MIQREVSGTVARVVRLLQCLADADGDVSIRDLSQRLSLPPSTIHRLLQLLIEDGIVERSATPHLYRSGVELLRISSLIAAKVPISDLALPFMRRVAEGCSEACMLVLYLAAARRVMVINSVDAANPLRYQIERFVPHSLLWGATGRSVLAFLPSETIEATLAEAEPSPVSGAPPPPHDEFMAAMGAIRERGYALTHGQKIEGAVGMGTPIFNAQGNVIGSLCVTVPMVRFTGNLEQRIATLLLREAGALNDALGHGARSRPPMPGPTRRTGGVR